MNESILRQTINDAISTQRIVGASIIVAKSGKVVFEDHAGYANREEKIPVTEHTLFRYASLTKPIVSAAALALVEAGVLVLDQPITNWLPEFQPKLANGETPVITLRHLLTHTAGLSYGFLTSDNEPYRSAGVSDGMDESVLSLEENLARLAKVPLLFAPGTSWCYSVATDVVGAIIEKACQKSLCQVVAESIARPLGMKSVSFFIADTERLARAYADGEPGNPARLMSAKDQVMLEGCGPIQFAPGRISNDGIYASGGTGLAGSAQDYLKFLEAIRKGGFPILLADSVKLLTQDVVSEFEVPAAGPGYGFSLGFAVVRDPGVAGTPRHKGTYEWGGVYGVKAFVDPCEELSVVILTNTALEGLGQFSVDVTNALYKALA